MEESISDYRTDHSQKYHHLRLVPTKKGLTEYRPPVFNRAAAFTAALKVVGCNEEGKVRTILASKRTVYDYLEKQHPGQFGTLETFSRSYARSGEWAQDLTFPIVWMSDKTEQ